jgi:hypothetical protein
MRFLLRETLGMSVSLSVYWREFARDAAGLYGTKNSPGFEAFIVYSASGVRDFPREEIRSRHGFRSTLTDDKSTHPD